MREAYVGIDVAFAKKKRLPIVVCVRRGTVLEPLPLRQLAIKPPKGAGNARILDRTPVDLFAGETAAYLRAIQDEHGVRIIRVAIDAPSAPKKTGLHRRLCEAGLDERGISYIATPSSDEFDLIRQRAKRHLAAGGSENQIPAANQLWMLVGFALFQFLRQEWECLEVFPQAIVAVLGANRIHKSSHEGCFAQLRAIAAQTGWPAIPGIQDLAEIGYGSSHDRLDAYMSAWVASLDESDRQRIGVPPEDVIWIPHVSKK